MVTLNEVWLSRLLAAIQYCQAYASGKTGEVYRGLFRVPASTEMLDELKQLVEREETVETVFSELESFRNQNGCNEESINGLASLLKWMVREMETPLVPFTYATVDVSEFNYDKVQDEMEKGRLGCQFAQDLIVTLANHLETYDVAIVSKTIAVVAQLFAMLCTVSRVGKIQMSAYNLTVPFLPSLCNSRDPVQLVKEHTQLTALSEKGGNDKPMLQLEVLILYGHRLWAYIEHILPSLDQVLKAIAEETESPGKRYRKRDRLKKVLQKMKIGALGNKQERRLSGQNENGNHQGLFHRIFNRKPFKESEGDEGDDDETERLGKLSVIKKSGNIQEEDIKRLGLNHVNSLRLETPILSGSPLEHAEANLVDTFGEDGATDGSSVGEAPTFPEAEITEKNDHQGTLGSGDNLGKKGTALFRSIVAKGGEFDSDSNARMYRGKSSRFDTYHSGEINSENVLRRISSDPL